ncbi:hypothetical protein GOBAR_DD09609 [Gossypium barbadense]|nr:hypothetical protein GOBAR_DD09609 [Gossypium barbadense]
MDEGESSMMEAQLANLTAMRDMPWICVPHIKTGKLMPFFQVREASTIDVNLGNLQAQVNNRLPSQPVTNPRDNVSAITLRSGKEVRPILEKVRYNNEEEETEVKRIRFNDKIEEISAMPRADIQPTQTSLREVEKSRLQEATVSCDAINLEQQVQSLEP